MKNKKDSLGDRIKSFYEDRTRFFLPRRTNTVVRLDGKAFHTFTRSFKKPFDERLIDSMDFTAKYLCENIQGAVLAYVQSDEISIFVQDYKKLGTDAWFDGNIQKISSISASIATAYFNNYMQTYEKPVGIALFDSRVFTIPSIVEVENYFVWRQNDCVRNSISMVAQSLYSHNELMNKSQSQMQEMIFQKGKNWNDYPDGQKRGRMIYKNDEGEWGIYPAVDILKDREIFSNLLKIDAE